MVSVWWNSVRRIRFTNRTYGIAIFLILGFIASYLFPSMYPFMVTLAWLSLFAFIADTYILSRHQAIDAVRIPKYQRLSNGDVNTIVLEIENRYTFPVDVTVVDELPFQFQIRNFEINTNLISGERRQFSYELRPLERGEYQFGRIHAFVTTKLGLSEKHYKLHDGFQMACYPSFIKLRQYELLAISNRLSDLGMKKIRKVGHSTEFEQIKEYVQGDDIRTINWKATARKSQLMVNHYRDERAQQVYCIVDMGRIMKMPFDGLSLLDYAVNASLVLGHVAWIKQDKPGLITFSNSVHQTVAADRKGNQLLRLQETLYNAASNFEESNYEALLTRLRHKVTQRSLLLLFTNFETLNGLKRQLKYLRRMASQHLVVVIFFENTELNDLLHSKADSTFKMYEQTIAQKFDYEKRQITKELRQYGILSIYTSPQQLTVNTLNKYLEIKTRGLI
ncbi:MAG: DUF58 domain-containing protein [Sediminibacterium sp.]|nr:DUF58 domain-containing protein [Sediminibacterium sp.]